MLTRYPVGATDYHSSRWCLTYWCRDKIADKIIRRLHFKMHFLMNMFAFCLSSHWSLFLRLEWTINIPALGQIMAWRRPGDKPLSESMVASLLTHICVIGLAELNDTWINFVDDNEKKTTIESDFEWNNLLVHLFLCIRPCWQKIDPPQRL